MKKNNVMIIWRIIFTLCIMIYHFSCIYPLFPWGNGSIGWYLFTDAFFMVSGFLLYIQMETQPDRYEGPWPYLRDRIKHIMPYYFICYIPYILYACVTDGIKMTAYRLSFQYHELFALQGVGLNEGLTYLNNTTWYISVLFIASYLIFWGLKRYKKIFLEVIGPVTVFIIYSYLYRTYGYLNLVTDTCGYFGNSALLRGIMDMLLGVYSAVLYQSILEKKQYYKWYGLLSGGGFVTVMILSCVYGFGKRDFLMVLILPFCICGGFLPSENTLLKSSILQRISESTICMYLLHSLFAFQLFPAVLGVPDTCVERWGYCILYVIVVTLISFLIYNGKHLIHLPKRE